MEIGFTGTREYITREQRLALGLVLENKQFTRGHHGDCVGADVVFNYLCKVQGIPVTIHPPDQDRYRAYCRLTAEDDAMKAPLPYLVRNKNIVDESSELVAVSFQLSETLRSGTWSTVRYAVKQNKLVTLIWPDGEIVEGWKGSPRYVNTE